MVRRLVWLINNMNMEAMGQGEDGLVRVPGAASAFGLYSEEPLRTTKII